MEVGNRERTTDLPGDQFYLNRRYSDLLHVKLLLSQVETQLFKQMQTIVLMYFMYTTVI